MLQADVLLVQVLMRRESVWRREGECVFGLCVDESYQHVVGGSGVWVAIPLKQKTRASSHLRLAFICRDVSCKSPAALSNV